MSIATRTGDDGTTALMYQRRLPKHHPRVEAYGTVDELNAALGLARSTATGDFIGDLLLKTQEDLVILMGELATHSDDFERFEKDGYKHVTPAMTGRLDTIVKEIEGQEISFKGWATPGHNLHSAALDMARTVCRRGERCVTRLREMEDVPNGEIIVYLNRLADLLWLCARWVETPEKKNDDNDVAVS
jgi:cob(I)alamin adenosyltransferase